MQRCPQRFLDKIRLAFLDNQHMVLVPAEIEKLVPALLEKIDYPAKLEELYSQRLYYGLKEYFIRQYVEDGATLESLE